MAPPEAEAVRLPRPTATAGRSSRRFRTRSEARHLHLEGAQAGPRGVTSAAGKRRDPARRRQDVSADGGSRGDQLPRGRPVRAARSSSRS